MIYMSLSDEIEMRRKQGELILLEPFLIAAPIRRRLYVSKDMYKFLTYPPRDEVEKAKVFRLQAALDLYVSGGYLAVALRHRKKPTANIARLHPPNREVWAIRVRAAEPQLRAFGRFAHTDLFVVFTCAQRSDIKGEDWDREIQLCQTEWDRLLSEPPYIMGSMKVDDYISTNKISV
jgi:hypothetical protein